jgi:energy-coupling factor transport system permease protein
MKIPAELKIIGLAAFSLIVVMAPVPWLAAPALALLLYILLTKANAAKMWRMFMPALPFIIFLCAAQAILAGGSETIVKLWIFSLSEEGARAAITSAARIVLLYLAGSAVTVTTSETEFAVAIRHFLSPADRIFHSSFGRDISTMMMLAIAFMPAIVEEYASVKMAQEARGVSYGSPVKAFKGVISIAVPLLYSLSRRADNIAMAMESRCYGSEAHED